MKHQRGTALILVLMLSVILGLLMLQMGLTAREQVHRAQVLADRTEAELRAESREVAMEYTLLTEPWLKPAVTSVLAPAAGLNAPPAINPYVAAWNFYGEPFTVDSITFQLQDMSGLLPVSTSNSAQLMALLGLLGVEPTRATVLGDQLLAYQGVLGGLRRPELMGMADDPAMGVSSSAPTASPIPVTSTPLQALEELRNLQAMDEALYSQLEPLLTLYPTVGFNPLTAPAILLRATQTPSAAQGLIDMRLAGGLDQSAVNALTGLSANESTTFYPGPGIRLGLTLEYHGVMVRRDTVVVLKPYDKEALSVWSHRALSGTATKDSQT